MTDKDFFCLSSSIRASLELASSLSFSSPCFDLHRRRLFGCCSLAFSKTLLAFSTQAVCFFCRWASISSGDKRFRSRSCFFRNCSAFLVFALSSRSILRFSLSSSLACFRKRDCLLRSSARLALSARFFSIASCRRLRFSSLSRRSSSFCLARFALFSAVSIFLCLRLLDSSVRHFSPPKASATFSNADRARLAWLRLGAIRTTLFLAWQNFSWIF